MKIFISQKMRNKTHDEIVKERDEIFAHWIAFRNMAEDERIKSYLPELKFKDPITSLSQSLALMADADIVLVPKRAYVEIEISQEVGIDYDEKTDTFHNKPFDLKYIQEHIRGCELELLVALAYGKKVYYYDDKYNFTEV